MVNLWSGRATRKATLTAQAMHMAPRLLLGGSVTTKADDRIQLRRIEHAVRAEGSCRHIAKSRKGPGTQPLARLPVRQHRPVADPSQ
jgi:hypothetical protein